PLISTLSCLSETPSSADPGIYLSSQFAPLTKTPNPGKTLLSKGVDKFAMDIPCSGTMQTTARAKLTGRGGFNSIISFKRNDAGVLIGVRDIRQVISKSALFSIVRGFLFFRCNISTPSFNNQLAFAFLHVRNDFKLELSVHSIAFGIRRYKADRITGPYSSQHIVELKFHVLFVGADVFTTGLFNQRFYINRVFSYRFCGPGNGVQDSILCCVLWVANHHRANGAARFQNLI